MSLFNCLLVLFFITFNINYVFSYQCKDPTMWAGGCVPSAFCAFHKNGSLNTNIIPSYADFLVKQGVKTVIVNDPLHGCDTLSYNDINENLLVWMNVAKKYGLNVIAYIPGYAIPDVESQCGKAYSLGAVAVIIPPDFVYRYNTTKLRIDLLEERIGSACSQASVLADFTFKQRDGSTDNVAKFHIVATQTIDNYIGVRLSAASAMSVASVIQLTKCQVLLTYDSTIWAPIDPKYMAPMSSYSCSIFPKEIKQAYELVVHNRLVQNVISQSLKVFKKYGITECILNADDYNAGAFPYEEVIARKLFICVSGLDVGESRHYGIYKVLQGRDISSCLKKHEMSCVNGDNNKALKK